MVSVTFKSADGEETVISVKSGITIQEAAINNDVPGIDADCGGGCSCATCHVYIADEWMDVVGPPGDLEGSMLDVVEGSNDHSRLGCQIKITEEMDGLVLTTPEHQTGC
jgi:2Fe-2S ferredoxin